MLLLFSFGELIVMRLNGRHGGRAATHIYGGKYSKSDDEAAQHESFFLVEVRKDCSAGDGRALRLTCRTRNNGCDERIGKRRWLRLPSMRNSAILVHFLRVCRSRLSGARHTFIIIEHAPDARKVNDLLFSGQRFFGDNATGMSKAILGPTRGR